MGKAMKAMKAMKATKAMKVMKKSVIAKGKRAKSAVFKGSKEKTSTGLKKSDLQKIVSKKRSAAGKKAYARIKGWTVAVIAAKKALGLTGFIAVKKGTPLYKKAKELYAK